MDVRYWLLQHGEEVIPGINIQSLIPNPQYENEEEMRKMSKKRNLAILLVLLALLLSACGGGDGGDGEAETLRVAVRK